MLDITRKIASVLDRKQKRVACFLCFLMIIGGVLESLSATTILPLATAVVDEEKWAQSWYAKIICDVLHIQSQKEFIVIVLIALIALFVIKNLFLLFEQYVQFSFVAKSKCMLQCRLMHSYLFRPYTYYLSSSSGEIIRVITSDTNHLFSSLMKVLSFYTEAVTCLFLFITMLLVSSKIAIGMVVVIGLELIFILYILKPRIKRYGDQQRVAISKGNTWLLQSIKGIKSIKVATKEEYFEGKFCEYSHKTAEFERKYQTLSAAVSKIIESVTIVGALIVILVIVLSGKDLKSLIPELSVFLMAAVRILPSVNRISQSYTTIRFSEGGVNNILTAIKECDKMSKALAEEAGGNGKTTGFSDEIRFENVSFRYPSGERDVLRNASFSISRGDSVGIVGASGEGKTTTIDIMLGLFDPKAGKVTVDGKDIHQDLPGWFSLLAYVPQFIFICDDTIKANVAFGVEEQNISEEKVWEALEEASLGDFVRELPAGLETRVGEAGVRLSGGQIQRIGIARALYTNPEIIVFDEATSSLDNDTEAAVIETIKNLKGSKTLIIVAHRVSTIESCDKVYRVVDGEISRER